MRQKKKKKEFRAVTAATIGRTKNAARREEARTKSVKLEKWLSGYECLLCKHELPSFNPQHASERPGMATWL